LSGEGEVALLRFLDYCLKEKKKPLLLTLILQGSFLNLTSKLDSYGFVRACIQDRVKHLASLGSQLNQLWLNIVLSCMMMIYMLPLFVFLLIQHLWSISELLKIFN
jgi:hypothetical protein